MKKLIMLLIMSIFLISLVSASWEIDNRITSYEENDRVITFKNWFGLGKTLGKAKLITPHINYVMQGKDRKVMIFEIENFGEEYENGLTDLEIKNMNSGLFEDKDYHWEMGIVVGQREIEHNICIKVDGTICLEEKLDYIEYEDIIEWNELKSTTFPKGKILIALVTDVGIDDYYDGIPELFGEKVKRWAIWTSGLSVGLENYWTLNETGTIFNDSVSGFNGTAINNASAWTNGKIGGGVKFNKTDDSEIVIDSVNDFNNTLSRVNNYSISLWVNTTTVNGAGSFIGRGFNPNFTSFGYSGDANDIGFYLNSKENDSDTGDLFVKTSTNDLTANVWHHLVVIYNGSLDASGVKMFIDGVAQSSTTVLNDLGKADTNGTNFLGGDAVLLGVGFQNSTARHFNGTIDEVGIWNRILSDSEISDLYNGGDGITLDERTLGTTSISVTLNLPSNDTTTISNEITFNSSALLTGAGNITNATAYLWYQNTTLISTNFTTLSGVLNTTNLSIALPFGDLEWNTEYCAMNNTGSLCEFAPNNFTLTKISFTETSQVYNNDTYETMSEEFQLNMSVTSDQSIYLAKFIYNGTEHTVSDIIQNGTNWNLIKRIDIPLNPNPFINDTKSFFWNITFSETSSGQITTTQHQNISSTIFVHCNETYDISAVNFTIRDENNNSELNGTLETDFDFWVGQGNVRKNLSFSDTNNNVSRFNFCIFPRNFSSVNTTFKTDMDLEYDATLYDGRTWFFRNASLTNATSLIDLLLLATADSQIFYIDVIQGTTRINNATVTITKEFIGEGTFKTVSIRLTDELGKFVEYFELDKKYRFTVVKNGVFLGTLEKTMSCSATPCELTLQLDEAGIDIFQGYFNEFAQNIAFTLDHNSSTNVVTYTYTDLTGLAQFARLNVNRMSLNSTTKNICNTQLFSTAGTIVCNVSGNQGNFRAVATISRSPELTVDYFDFVISTLKDSLGLTLILVSFFILLIIVLAFSQDPSLGTISIPVGLTILKLMEFLPLSWTTIVVLYIIAIGLAWRMNV